MFRARCSEARLSARALWPLEGDSDGGVACASAAAAGTAALAAVCAAVARLCDVSCRTDAAAASADVGVGKFAVLVVVGVVAVVASIAETGSGGIVAVVAAVIVGPAATGVCSAVGGVDERITVCRFNAADSGSKHGRDASREAPALSSSSCSIRASAVAGAGWAEKADRSASEEYTQGGGGGSVGSSCGCTAAAAGDT